MEIAVAKRVRPRVEFTETQKEILASVDGVGATKAEAWFKDQIRWRQELIDRYQAEIAALQERLAGPGAGE